MEADVKERLDAIEKKLTAKQKDIWDKIPALTSLLIPLTIAVAGWYYTNKNSRSQMEIQRLNNENQFQIALVNSNVGQSELIRDFIQHLTSPDTATRNIAIEAILYAAPTPGKKIVDVLSRTGDKQTRMFAIDALSGKRTDLVANLFSDQKQTRLVAANEMIANWSSDDLLLKELLKRTDECLSGNQASPNCSDGVFNAFAVLPSFSKTLLMTNKTAIIDAAKRIIPANTKTKKLADEIVKQIP